MTTTNGDVLGSPIFRALSYTSDPLIKEFANVFKCFQVLADLWE